MITRDEEVEDVIPLMGRPTRCPKCFVRILTWDFDPGDGTHPSDPDWAIAHHLATECG